MPRLITSQQAPTNARTGLSSGEVAQAAASSTNAISAGLGDFARAMTQRSEFIEDSFVEATIRDLDRQNDDAWRQAQVDADDGAYGFSDGYLDGVRGRFKGAENATINGRKLSRRARNRLNSRLQERWNTNERGADNWETEERAKFQRFTIEEATDGLSIDVFANPNVPAYEHDWQNQDGTAGQKYAPNYNPAQGGPVGNYPYMGAAVATSIMETGKNLNGANMAKAAATIALDTSGSRSYGIMGLNSLGGSGSMVGRFAAKFGARLGLKGKPNTPGFNASWQAAVKRDPQAMIAAQLDFHRTAIVMPTQTIMDSMGVGAWREDPRAIAYISDLVVQYGPGRKGGSSGAYGILGRVLNETKPRNAVEFMQNATNLVTSQGFINSHFRTYRKTHGSNHDEGLKARGRKRFNLSMRAGVDGAAAASVMGGQGAAAVIRGSNGTVTADSYAAGAGAGGKRRVAPPNIRPTPWEMPDYTGAVPSIQDEPGYAQGMSDIQARIDTMDAPPAVRRAAYEAAQRKVHSAWLGGVIRQNPAAAMAVLQSGDYEGPLDLSDVQRLWNGSQAATGRIEGDVNREMERQRVNARNQMLFDISTHNASVDEAEKIAANFQKEYIRSQNQQAASYSEDAVIHAQKTGQRLAVPDNLQGFISADAEERIDVAVDGYQTGRVIMNGTPQEAAAEVAKIAAGVAEGVNPSYYGPRLDAARAALDAKRASLESDAFSHVAAGNPALRYGNGDNEGSLSNEAVQARLNVEEQLNQGATPDQVRAMPKAQSQAWAEQFSDSENPAAQIAAVEAVYQTYRDDPEILDLALDNLVQDGAGQHVLNAAEAIKTGDKLMAQRIIAAGAEGHTPDIDLASTLSSEGGDKTVAHEILQGRIIRNSGKSKADGAGAVARRMAQRELAHIPKDRPELVEAAVEGALSIFAYRHPGQEIKDGNSDFLEILRNDTLPQWTRGGETTIGMVNQSEQRLDAIFDGLGEDDLPPSMMALDGTDVRDLDFLKERAALEFHTHGVYRWKVNGQYVYGSDGQPAMLDMRDREVPVVVTPLPQITNPRARIGQTPLVEEETVAPLAPDSAAARSANPRARVGQ